MIKLKKKYCSGCGMCAAICPVGCIEMRADKDGFVYPHVDKAKCVGCGKCNNRCPVLNKRPQPRTLRKAYAMKSNDSDIRFNSSSGGMFTAIAEYVIDRGGVVFGAAFREDFSVAQTYAETKEDLRKFRGSKYVQSDAGDSYAQAEKFLKEGRMVLYSGTPCLIAALKAYLGKDYDGLITVDLICHGVPANELWQKYIEYRKSKDGATELTEAYFRDKTGGGVS